MEQLQQLWNTLPAVIVNILAAILILLVGWIVGRLVASLVRRLLNRTGLDNRIAKSLLGDEQRDLNIEEIIGRVVFWIIMLFALVAVFQQLNLPAVAEPINALLSLIMTVYLPRLAGAALILFVAWLVATAVRLLIERGAKLLRLDARLSQHGALEEGEQVSVSDSLATAAYWFIFLLFLPSALARLGLAELAEPVQEVIQIALTYIPNVAGAALILIIGWFIARILRQVLTNLLAAVGANRLGERAGLVGERTLSNLVGTAVYTVVLLFTVIAALEELDIAAVSEPATLMLNAITVAIPGIIGAALVLIISFYIARLVARLVTDLLTSFGVNEIPQRLGLSLDTKRTLSELIGYVIQIGIMLFATLSAVELLGSEFLSTIISAFIAFAGQVLLALIIFAIGLYLANLAHDLVVSTGSAQANLLAMLARVAILVLAGAMGLRQMGIADDIVNLAFGILLGALGVAAALAFGLGGRDTAGREIDRFVDSLRSNEASE